MSKKLNIFSVTSLEKDRIKIIKVNEIDLVEKMTTVKEFANIKKAEKLLNDSDSFINHNNNTKTKILVPKPIKWKENKLLMEYCLGINLESLIMKNDKKRKFYINILFGILSWMKNNSFYWQDFAPRNILYNSTKNTITLVDFESDLIIKTKKKSDKDFYIFTQNRIALELATVLLPEEQNYLLPNIWLYSRKITIPMDKISGRRRRSYIMHHKPGINKIEHEELVKFEKKITYIATPFYYNDELYYPLISLSKIKSIDKYIKTTLEIENKKKKYWPEIINNRSGN